MESGQTMSGKIELQLVPKRFVKLDTVGTSAICEGSLFHDPAERKAKTVFRPAR